MSAEPASKGTKRLLGFVDALLKDPKNARLDIAELPEDQQELGARLLCLGASLSGRGLAADDDSAAMLSSELNQILANQRILELEARTDALTELGNRSAFEIRVDELWGAGEHFTLAFIDLDNLKTCNDRFGHKRGNAYIQQTAFFIENSLVPGEQLFRLGGDEFVLISTTSGVHELEERLESVRTQLSRATAANGAMPFSFSFGCARVRPGKGNSRSHVTAEADRRMYSYKVQHRVKTSVRLTDAREEGPGDDDSQFFSERVFDAISMTLDGRYFFVSNIDLGVTRWTADAVRDFGLPYDKMYGDVPDWIDHVHPEDRAGVLAEFRDITSGKKHHHEMEYRVRDAEGDYVVCKSRGFRLTGDDRRPALFVGSLTNRNASECVDPATGIENVTGMLNLIGDCRLKGRGAGIVGIKVSGLSAVNATEGYAAGDGVFAAFIGRLEIAMRGKARIFRGRGPQIGLVKVGATHKETQELCEAVLRTAEEPLTYRGESYRIRAHVASLCFSKVVSQPFTVIGELTRRLRVAERRDKAISADASEAAEELGRLDPLTGLRMGEDFIAAARRLRGHDCCMEWCVVALDTGDLAIFNEWHGTDAGEVLVGEIAGILQDVEAGGEGVGGYWGQDDFSLLVHMDEDLLEQILGRVTAAVERHDASVGFLPAMGVYPLLHGEEITVDVYAKALFAKQTAKHSYENRIGFFRPAAFKQRADEHELLAGFQYALGEGEITFDVQPQVDIRTGLVVGGEALTRWRRPDGTSVSPAQFVPILERNGFIPMLDKFIWHSVIKWQSELIARGAAQAPISVNVSRMDITGFDVPAFLGRMLTHYRVSPSLIKAEVTETSFAQSREAVEDLASTLKSMGVAVYMDDFGSGMSSLGMLKGIDVDAIKFDREFLIHEVEENGQTASELAAEETAAKERGGFIVDSMIVMAKNLDIPVIVEGAESEEQIAFLKAVGARYVQGFYYYRPMPPEAFERLVSNERGVDGRGVRLPSERADEAPATGA